MAEGAAVAWKWEQACEWLLAASGRVPMLSECFRRVEVWLESYLEGDKDGTTRKHSESPRESHEPEVPAASAIGSALAP